MDMSIQNENIRKFMEKLGQDQELQERFSQIRDPDEAYALASSVQEGFTREEFVAEMKKLYEELTKDLSDDDLEKVAGGLSKTSANVISSVAGSFFGASVAATAAYLISGSSAAAI